MAKKRREVQMEKKAKKTKAKTPKRTHAKRFGITMAFIILLLIGAMYFYYAQIIVPTRESERPLTILLVGSDVSDFREEYFMGTKPEKTDALMVVTFNPNTYTVDMTSVPRDTSVDYVCDSIQYLDGTEFTGDPYQDQVNELYQVSGKNMSCLTDTIGNFLNVPIDYYVKVNMDQLASIIDAIGGVEITVHAADYYLSQENASLTETYYWTDGETVEMDGDEALTYARARHDSEVDYGRGLRQQQVVAAISQKILSAGFSLDLVDSLFSLVETDMPIKLIYEYYKYFMSITVVAGMIDGDSDLLVEDLPDTVWLNLYDLTGFEGTLVGTDKQRQAEIEEFMAYLQSGAVDLDALKEDMLKNHQLYNSSYSGHYNAQYDQLYEVSNELRKNLGLEEEDIDVPSNVYGDNYAYGLMPSETTLKKEGLYY